MLPSAVLDVPWSYLATQTEAGPESQQELDSESGSDLEPASRNRIVELDVNGGEPTASKNYKKLLSNLPSNIRIVRINTNGKLDLTFQGS